MDTKKQSYQELDKSLEELVMENEKIARKTIKELGGKIDDELLSCR